MEPAPTHLLFDFFGTLVHYSPSWTEQGYRGTHRLLRDAGIEIGYDEFLEAWSRTTEALELRALETLEEYPFDRLVETFLAPLTSDVQPSLLGTVRDSYLREWCSAVRAIDGLRDMLLRLRERFTLGVVSNTNDARLVTELLCEHGLADCFSHVELSVDHGRRKPCVGIFHAAVEQLGASPERCLYVGDSLEPDYRGARGAGLSAWLIDPGRRAGVPEAHRLDSILEVEARLR